MTVPTPYTHAVLRVTKGIARRGRRPAPGQAAIEFAVVLPVLLLIGLLTVDVGRVMFDYIGLRAAAMEGAKYGALRPEATEAEIVQRVDEHFLPNPPPAGRDVSTAEPDANCVSPDPPDGFYTVTVTREFQPVAVAALQSLAPGTDWILTVSSTARTRCMT